MDLAHGTQAVTFTSSLIGVFIWWGWARKNRDRWLYAIAPITWLLHVAAFYLVYFLAGGRLTDFLILWGAIARMHGAFLVIGIGAGLYFEHVNLVRKKPIL
jgi:hypothetical protein